MEKNRQINSRLRHSMRGPGGEDRNYSLHHLHTLNRRLEAEKEQANKLLQKIKQQQSLSSKIGSAVGVSIMKVENDGAYFASKLEEEKRKHNALLTLVAHYEASIEKEKMVSYEEAMKTKKIMRAPLTHSKTFYSSEKMATSPAAPEQLSLNQECREKEKQLQLLERELDQYVVRTNASEYELDKKLDEVRTLRSERTVFNKVFDQFEKQIFQHELGFKQLVIQRAVLEAHFDDRVREYERMHAQASREFDRLAKAHQDHGTQRILDLLSSRRNLQESNEEERKLVGNLPMCRNTYASCELQSSQRWPQKMGKKVNFKVPTNECSSNRASGVGESEQRSFESEWAKYRHMKKVKEIYEQLKIKNVEELPTLTANLDTFIASLFQQSESLYDTLYRLQKDCGKAHGHAERDQTSKSDVEGQKRRRKELEERIVRESSQVTKIREELSTFYHELDRIHHEETQQGEAAFNLEELQRKIEEVEKALEAAEWMGSRDKMGEREKLASEATMERNTPNKRNTEKSNESLAAEFVVNLSQFSVYANEPRDTKAKNRTANKESSRWGGEGEECRLEEILRQNRRTDNNTTIYSNEDLVKIGRYYLEGHEGSKNFSIRRKGDPNA